MTDKEANTYCGKCIKADVCGMEGVYDPATTYCAYRSGRATTRRVDRKYSIQAKRKEIPRLFSLPLWRKW